MHESLLPELRFLADLPVGSGGGLRAWTLPEALSLVIVLGDRDSRWEHRLPSSERIHDRSLLLANNSPSITAI